MPYPAVARLDAEAHIDGREATLKVVDKQGGPTFPWHEKVEEVVAHLTPLAERIAQELVDLAPRAARTDERWQDLEAAGAIALHRALPYDHEALADREFWFWLACGPFRCIIERRYVAGDGEPVNEANFGFGRFEENFVYRLWRRADCVFDEDGRNEDERYRLVERGQSDFWRSHVFRQGYGARRSFVRALVAVAYPDPAAPRRPALSVSEIRELAKRLRRLASNIELDLLDETEARALIGETAEIVRKRAPQPPAAQERELRVELSRPDRSEIATTGA